MPTRTDIVYASGLFDGEGSIYMPQGKYVRIEVSVSQKIPAVLYWFMSTFGGHVYGKGVFQWKINGTAGVGFLRLVLPFLMVKQVDAREAIELWENKHDATKLTLLYSARRTRRGR